MDTLVPILPNPESALAQLLYSSLTRIPTHEIGTVRSWQCVPVRAPRQFGLCSMSRSKTRLSRLTQLMRARFLALPDCRDGKREQYAGPASEPWHRIKGLMMRSAFGLRQAVIETPDGIAAAGCDGWAGRCSVSAQPALLNRDRLDRNPVLAQWQGSSMSKPRHACAGM